MLGEHITKVIEEKLLSFKMNNDILLFLYLFVFISIVSFPLITYVQVNVTHWHDFKIVEEQAKYIIVDVSDLAYNSHAVKRLFRLTPAMIMRVFSLNIIELVYLQYMLGVVFVFVFVKILKNSIPHFVNRFYIGISFASMYLMKSFYCDYLGFFDAFSFFFILLVMFLSNPILIFIFSSLALWNDERSIISLCLVILYNRFVLQQSLKELLLKIDKKTIAIILSLIGYISLRLYITHVYNIHINTYGIGFLWNLKHNYPFFPIFFIFVFEGFIILSLQSLYILYKQKNNYFFYLFLLVVVFSVFFIYNVSDIIRSASYLFPLIFLFIKIFESESSINEKYKTSVYQLVCFISLLIPAYFNLGAEIKWIKPGYIEFLNAIF